MNTITQAERDRLVNLAKQAIRLDETGEIVAGFEPAWRAFQAEHGIIAGVRIRDNARSWRC